MYEQLGGTRSQPRMGGFNLLPKTGRLLSADSYRSGPGPQQIPQLVLSSWCSPEPASGAPSDATLLGVGETWQSNYFAICGRKEGHGTERESEGGQMGCCMMCGIAHPSRRQGWKVDADLGGGRILVQFWAAIQYGALMAAPLLILPTNYWGGTKVGTVQVIVYLRGVGTSVPTWPSFPLLTF